MIVVGSYERADRAITVQELAELAELYDGVRTEQLLPGDGRRSPCRRAAGRGTDLRRLAACSHAADRTAGPYASTIQSQRDDYNGKVLTIRERDLQSLAAVYDVQPDNLTAMLLDWGVLVAEPPDASVR